jgi:hypothetical protein
VLAFLVNETPDEATVCSELSTPAVKRDAELVDVFGRELAL